MILITDKNQYFSPHEYIENLLDAIGFDDKKSKERKEMYEVIADHVGNTISNALHLYLEPHIFEEIKEDLEKSSDFWDMAEKAVSKSPNAQIAIAQDLDDFYTNTIETYQAFNQ